ncbi:hypothetical protein NPIL_25611 [Nephila pilipes]|uniref:Uncharacterized protein n=1 Tax=Nephila pilipes TaxID=299642 RepID=A0A8X6KBL7_NEPPI|nr:hypothetical protein NPIL_25611 [Nephila pilipes]
MDELPFIQSPGLQLSILQKLTLNVGSCTINPANVHASESNLILPLSRNFTSRAKSNKPISPRIHSSSPLREPMISLSESSFDLRESDEL